MRKKISLLILNGTGGLIKQTAVSKALIGVVSLVLLGGMILSGYIVFDYYKLKQTSFRTLQLEKQITIQHEEIAGQRSQIQNFAKDINVLKKKLISLNGFENKIRIIANIEKSQEHDSLFGVGGSVPEDLDTGIDLKQKHGSLLREMHTQMGQLGVASNNQSENFESLLQYLEEQRNLLAATPAIRPMKGWVTSRFGYRTSPFTGRREFHKGLDIAAREGTPILASADGIITFAGNKGLLGQMLIIDHGHGIITRYGHVREMLMKPGDRVKRGDTIALVGNTGRSTGPHLHYEVLLNGVPVNPEKYFLN